MRPRQAHLVAAGVRLLAMETVVVGGRAAAAKHRAVTLSGNGRREFWFSPSGDLLKAAVPGRQVTAIRQSLPGR